MKSSRLALRPFRIALFFDDDTIVEGVREDVDAESAASMFLSEEAARRRTNYLALAEHLLPGGVLASDPAFERALAMDAPLPPRREKKAEKPLPAPQFAADGASQLCLAF